MTRTQMGLCAVLFVQIVLIVMLRSPLGSAVAGSEARPLVPGLDQVEVARVEIRGPGDEWLTLERDGTGWSVGSVGGYPVDGGKVDDLIDDLRGLEVRRPVVTSGRYHASLEVTEDEPEGRVRVYAEGSEDPAADLILGSSPNYRTTHVRTADDDRVYEVRGLEAADVRPDASAWVEREYLSVDTDRVVGVGLANAEGSFELERVGEQWQAIAPAGGAREIDPDEVESLVRSVASLYIADPVGPVDDAVHGFDEAAATLTLRLQADADEVDEGAALEEEVVLVVGKVLDDNESQRYVRKIGFPFAATVWNSSVEELVATTLDDLAADE
jgi:hypothetical protein